MSFLFLLTAALLLAGIPTGVQAQKSKAIQPTPPIAQNGPLKGNYFYVFNGLELSRGQSTASWSSYGSTAGDLNGFMFMSLNLAPLGSSSGTTVSENVDSQVTGGTWSKLIFVNNVYTGSVYGKVLTGSVTWVNSETANIQLQVTADNGTLIYSGLAGKGSFNGSLTRSGSGQGTVSGSINLTY
jgi:hypothetical protein